MKRIALVGDRNEAMVAHRAIPIALQMAVEALQVEVGWEWVSSRTLRVADEARWAAFAGTWCVPGSPYENPRGVLDAIRHARTAPRPFLGTCGGFQHALIEYAQNVWQVGGGRAEGDPSAEDPVVAPLACALVEVRNRLHFVPGSRLHAIYGRDESDEEYHCSYGFNPLHEARLVDGPLRVSARDQDGTVRAVELTGHPFFIGTLFQPERAALRDELPPLVRAFVAAVAATPEVSSPMGAPR